MADAVTTTVKFITSPPAVLVAGVLVAGAVKKFFDGVGDLLSDGARETVALRLMYLRAEPLVSKWPSHFQELFERVFGAEQFSWICIRRSAWVTLLSLPFLFLLSLLSQQARFLYVTLAAEATFMVGVGHPTLADLTEFLVCASLALVMLYFVTFCIPDFLALLKSRYAIRLFERNRTPQIRAVVLACDALLSLAMGAALYALYDGLIWLFFQKFYGFLHQANPLGDVGSYVLRSIRARIITQGVAKWFVGLVTLSYPMLFSWFWFVLYGSSVWLLGMAGRFDRFFEWFKGAFDIENKPHKAISIVASALTAFAFWSFAALSWFIR